MNSLAALPLSNEQTDKLRDAISELSPAQLQWVSGYAAGLAAKQGIPHFATEPTQHASACLAILYGSQTGNGEQLAHELGGRARQQGFDAEVVSLADFKPAALRRLSLVAFVISTHGEGDPPDDAELFLEYLDSDKVPALSGLRYSVLALGDSSYANFCKTGRELDLRLESLGATSFCPRAECDLDYEGEAREWSGAVIARLPELLDARDRTPLLHAVSTPESCSKHNPFPAQVLVNQKITGRDSTRDVRHIELSIEGSGIRYEPGDSLAVIAVNPPRLVDELLEELALDGGSQVALHGAAKTLREALADDLEITALNIGFLRAWVAVSGSDELESRLDHELSVLLDGYQIIDIVRAYPASVTAEQLVAMLRAMSPRSYSIASSPDANPGEVHLTVAALRYEAFGVPHEGAASTFLADRIDEGGAVRVYVESNKRFRLPAPDTPMIMIGPGTGIAPFRAFMEQRIEQKASGDNWLFFGERNFSSDFLYQLEWQRHLRNGHLTRMDVAFSRDQRHKVYVQDRIAAEAAEFYRWIERGACIYVCGDEKRMAKDVHEAVLGVIASQGRTGRDEAEAMLKAMRRDGRYQRDVY